MEYEIKLCSPTGALPADIKEDGYLRELINGNWESLPMRTTYYDTPDGTLRALFCTLRTRLEGDTRVVTMKTPSSTAGAREEYEVEAPDLADGIPLLIRDGAPEWIGRAASFVPVCGAEFTRERVTLKMKHCTAELAFDKGRLFRENRELYFQELEIELKEGEQKELPALADYLCKLYGLVPQHKSKFARAVSL